MYFLPQNESES